MQVSKPSKLSILRISLIINLSLCFCLSGTAQDNIVEVEPLFITDWTTALDQAAASGKPIVVDFYTDWCYWCKVMDKETFAKKEVIGAIKENYIAVKLDAERGVGKLLAMKYRISSYPTTAFYNTDGHLIGKIPGYYKAKAFVALLDSMRGLNIAGQNLFPGISTDLNLEYPDFFSKSFGPNGERKYPEDELVQNWVKTQDSTWESEVYFSTFAKFVHQLDQEPLDRFLNRRERYAALFGAAEVASIVDRHISVRYYKLVKETDKEGFSALLLDLKRLIPDQEQVEIYQERLTMDFNADIKNYQDLSKMILDAIEQGRPISNARLNQYAWDIYENSDENSILQNALKWMRPVVDSEPSYAYLDTYAALAYKLGLKKIAKNYALEAIKVGNANDENVKETEVLLDKIKNLK